MNDGKGKQTDDLFDIFHSCNNKKFWKKSADQKHPFAQQQWSTFFDIKYYIYFMSNLLASSSFSVLVENEKRRVLYLYFCSRRYFFELKEKKDKNHMAAMPK